MSNNIKHIIFNLPHIIVHILSCLPVKSLLQVRCVCKSFRLLISHPSFVKRHLSSTPNPDDHHLLIYYETDDYKYEFYSLRSPITLQETLKLQTPDKALHGYLRIVGSNKGLICFFDTNYFSNVGRVILWNPSVNKYNIVCDPVYDELHDKFSHFAVGFGFVARDLEFKVVEIVYYSDKVNVVSDVLVYSLSSNSWKRKDNMMAPCYLNRGWSSNVMVNGFVNWLARKGPSKGAEYAIMAFDLDNECFGVVELPRNLVCGYDQLYLVPCGESMRLSLCAHYYVKANGVDKWDMWVMGDYGMVDSWMKVSVVLQANLSNPPLLMKSYHHVFVVTNDGRLALFDAVKKQMWNLATSGLKESFRAVNYTASLALFDHGY